VARYALLEVGPVGTERLAFRAVRYDAAPLFLAFEERAVPERAFVRVTFFGGQGGHSATELAATPESTPPGAGCAVGRGGDNPD
jgi:hypothetical protein